MEIKQFQRAAGISEALAARWFSHITSAMKEFGISKAEDQAQDILVGLQMCAGGSEYLVPGRYNFRKPLSNAALNSLIDRTVKIINEDGEHIQDFTVHDMRRTASTLLHEAGYPSDWIEKALAHEQKGVRAVYNKAEYARQRAYMLQQWADMIDSWINGEHTDLIPFSPSKFEKWMAGE
jgi:integrase